MSTVQQIIKLLEQGYTPSEIVRMGYPRSTVYYAYRKFRESRSLARPEKVYLAYDTAKLERVRRLEELLVSLDIKPVVGPLRDSIDISRFIAESDLVLGIADRAPSLRHDLFLKELDEATRLRKRIIVVAEKGAILPEKPNMIKITYSDDAAELRRSVIEAISKLGREASTEDVFKTLLSIVLVGIAAIGVAALIAAFLDLLTSSARK